MKPLTLDHLTVLTVGPPDLITLGVDAGYQAVGVRLTSPIPGGPEYRLRPGTPAMNETLKRMADTGVSIFDIEVVLLAPETNVLAYEETFEAGARLGAKRVCVNVDDPDRARAVERFAELCDLGARYGLAMDVEFMIFRKVATLLDAADVITKAGKSNGGILVDTLHLMRSGGNPQALAALDPKLIGSVQLCDAPLTRLESLSFTDEARSDRLPPGEGELPLHAILDVLPDTVPLAVEVPMTRRHPDMTPLERARRIYTATRQFLSSREADISGPLRNAMPQKHE
jgi:sugar phosphate isomerase/epimerase